MKLINKLRAFAPLGKGLMLIFLFSACEKEIEYTGDAVLPILVLNADIKAGEEITCDLTRSVSIFESTQRDPDDGRYYYDTSLRDAQLELYCDGELIGEPTWSGYNYRWGEVAQEGKEYTIKASHPTYENISASTKVLAQPEITDVHVQADYSRYETHFSITLNDEPGKNYYRLNAFREMTYKYTDYGEEDGYSESVSTHNIEIYSNDAILNYNKAVTTGDDLFADYPPNVFMIFDDALFEGKSQKVNFYYDYISKNDEWCTYVYIFEVQQISKELYLYYKSIDHYDYYDESPFSEPVMVYSNVEGGAGILGSSSKAEVRVENPFSSSEGE